MGAAAIHRQAIVDTAVRLFRKQGYAATGLNQIVEESGAPKGSLYHYFPEGKTAIAEGAARTPAAKGTGTSEALVAEQDDPARIYRRYLDLMAGWMAQSGYRDGSPITTTLLETAPQIAALRDAGAQALSDWAQVLAGALSRKGVPAARAERLARVAIAALEGALLQVRVSEDRRPLDDAAGEIGGLFEDAVKAAKAASAVDLQ